MVSASRERSRSGGTVAVVGAGPVMVVCCAGPLLLGGAALGAVGGALANPWLITVGAVALAAGTAYARGAESGLAAASGRTTAARPSRSRTAARTTLRTATSGDRLRLPL